MTETTLAADERSASPTAVASGECVQRLAKAYAGADTRTLLTAMLREVFPGRIALVSSFGAEAAVLLHLVASIEPSTTVIFLDTGKLFGETKRYRDRLIAEFGLSGVRTVAPDPARIAALDPDGVLWYGNPDMCCHIRKVEPLARALAGFDAWINGRKGFQGGERSTLQRIELDDERRIKINPLADWQKSDLDAYFERHQLPRHPLEADGFLSIGCLPCTDRVAPGEDARAGRWRGRAKTECGIHLSAAHWKVHGID